MARNAIVLGGSLIMPVGNRSVVAGIVLAVSLSGCAVLGWGDDLADCEAVRVSFEDTLGTVRGAEGPSHGDEEENAEHSVYDEERLRSAVELHDSRRECFGDETGDFVEPARELLGDDDPAFESGPSWSEDAGEPPGGMLGEDRSGSSGD